MITVPDYVLWPALAYLLVAFYLALELGKTAVRSERITPLLVLCIAAASLLWFPIGCFYGGRRIFRSLR